MRTKLILVSHAAPSYLQHATGGERRQCSASGPGATAAPEPLSSARTHEEAPPPRVSHSRTVPSWGRRGRAKGCVSRRTEGNGRYGASICRFNLLSVCFFPFAQATLNLEQPCRQLLA